MSGKLDLDKVERRIGDLDMDVRPLIAELRKLREAIDGTGDTAILTVNILRKWTDEQRIAFARHLLGPDTDAEKLREENEVAKADAFRANRSADEVKAELRNIAAYLKCPQNVYAVRAAIDARNDELQKLREENARLKERQIEAKETIEAFQEASGLCVPAEEQGGDPGGVQPRHVGNHIDKLVRHAETLAKRVEELTAQRNSAFDTANTARALLSRVEELERLLRTWAISSWTTPGPEEGRAWLALYSEAMRLADVECEAYCRARAQVPA